MLRSTPRLAVLAATALLPVSAWAAHSERAQLKCATEKLDKSAHLFEQLACGQYASPHLTHSARIFVKKVHRLRDNVNCRASICELQDNVASLRHSVRMISTKMAYSHAGPRLLRAWDCTVSDFRDVAQTVRRLAYAPRCNMPVQPACNRCGKATCRDGRCGVPARGGFGLRLDIDTQPYRQQLPRRGPGPRGHAHGDVGRPIVPPAVPRDYRSASHTQLLQVLASMLR